MMLNFKVLAMATILGWLAVATAQIAQEQVQEDPQGEVRP